MLANIRNIWAFCHLFGWWFVLSKVFVGVFGRTSWWVFGCSVEEYDSLLKKHLSQTIQKWFLSEQKHPLDPKGEGIIVLCGFLIYVYAHKDSVSDLWKHCQKTIEYKRKWLIY